MTDIQKDIVWQDFKDLKDQILLQNLIVLHYNCNDNVDTFYSAISDWLGIKKSNNHIDKKSFNKLCSRVRFFNRFLGINWKDLHSLCHHPSKDFSYNYSQLVDKLIKDGWLDVYSHGSFKTKIMEKAEGFAKKYIVKRFVLENYLTNFSSVKEALEKLKQDASSRIRKRIDKLFDQYKPDEEQKDQIQPFTLSIKTPMKFKNKQEEDFWNKRIEAITQMANELQALASGKDLSEILPFKTDNVEERIEALPKTLPKAPQQKIQKESKIELKNDFDIGNDIPEEFFEDKPKQKTYYNTKKFLNDLYHKMPNLLERNISPTGAKRVCNWFNFPIDINTQHTFIGQTGNYDYMLLRRLYNCIYTAYKEGKFTMNDIYQKQDFQNWLKDYESKLVA